MIIELNFTKYFGEVRHTFIHWNLLYLFKVLKCKLVSSLYYTSYMKWTIFAGVTNISDQFLNTKLIFCTNLEITS